jgi:hypothetical protein
VKGHFPQDPTNLLNLFRYVAAIRYGDPNGHIQGQGKQPNLTKAGPGRRRTGPWNACRHGAKYLRKD